MLFGFFAIPDYHNLIREKNYNITKLLILCQNKIVSFSFIS